MDCRDEGCSTAARDGSDDSDDDDNDDGDDDADGKKNDIDDDFGVLRCSHESHAE